MGSRLVGLLPELRSNSAIDPTSHNRSGFWPCTINRRLDVVRYRCRAIPNRRPPPTAPSRSFQSVSIPCMHDAFLSPAASSAVDARPFQGLCMGDLRVVPPRNFSDFPGHSQLLLIRYADDKEPHPCFGGPCQKDRRLQKRIGTIQAGMRKGRKPKIAKRRA